MNSTDATLIGILALVLGAVGTGLLKIWSWATNPKGPIERVIDSHLDFVKSSRVVNENLLKATETQEKLHLMHFTECTSTAESMRVLLISARRACDTLDLIAQEAHLSGDVCASISEIRDALESRLQARG